MKITTVETTCDICAEKIFSTLNSLQVNINDSTVVKFDLCEYHQYKFLQEILDRYSRCQIIKDIINSHIPPVQLKIN